MIKEKKETKAERVERIKKEKDGLDVLKDIHFYAKSGTSVDPEDIDRLKWYGLYTQNTNLQAEDDDTLYFMLRVKLISGSLNVVQLKKVAEISKLYARSTADFTTRQDLQFHFITMKDLPAIFSDLKEVGLSSVFAAGDVPRNVVTCPVNGIDISDTCDVTDIVAAVNRYFDGNKTLSNLPRKYKVGISACSKHCMSHEIQDLSFNAKRDENGFVVFDVSVGGGLASNKQIATHIGNVSEEQVLAVTQAVTQIYRDYGNRKSRTKARLGHIIKEFGIEWFRNVLEEKLNFKLKQTVLPTYTPYAKREHFGVHASKVKNVSYIGCAVSAGSVGATTLEQLSKILAKNGATTIKLTTTQNFVITDVPNDKTQEVLQELQNLNIEAFPSPFRARTLACTGTKFCKFAISETKDLAQELIEYLEEKFPTFNETISLSVNGCPHSCAHPHIVDIGLLGCKLKEDNQTVTGFELILGGNLEGEKSNFGKKTGIKFTPQKSFTVIENILREYINSESQSFREYLMEKIVE